MKSLSPSDTRAAHQEHKVQTNPAIIVKRNLSKFIFFFFFFFFLAIVIDLVMSIGKFSAGDTPVLISDTSTTLRAGW